MLKALRKRSIALLWGGQALSAIGDEIYRVALIWLAVSLIGADTGYLAAGQSAALLVLSLVGGKWADQWNHVRTMVWVDGLRALIVLIPVVLFHFMPISLTVLWVVALSVSALSAFFDPALLATLPRLSQDNETLQAANGLMSTTVRLARAVGPGVVGLLSAFIPIVHFFTIDAFSFVCSALSVRSIRKHVESDGDEALRPRLGFRESIVSGFQAVSRSRTFSFIMAVKGIGGGIWSLGYTLGLALFVQRIAPGDVRAYGLAIASYGVGNFSSALVLGNMTRKRPAALLYLGYLIMGAGFLVMGMAPSLPWLMAGAVCSGFGGLMNDLPFVDLVQFHFSIGELPKIFRLRMALETSATLVCMTISPMIFRAFHPGLVIAGCGFVFLVLGIIGFSSFIPIAEPSLPQ